MRLRKIGAIRLVAAICAMFFLCEFLVYYIVIYQCNWPSLPSSPSSPYFDKEPREVYAMFLADTHLLGSRNGHWFDKLRREWQMHRAFQTAITIHRPEIIFVLGDIFDEGLWCSGVEFNQYVDRFHSLFAVPKETKMYIVVGNHDIGFHSRITPYLAERFVKKLKSPPVQMISIRGNHFVLINSMAMEGDGCFLCSGAESDLTNISTTLKCSRGIGNCHNVQSLHTYSRPILLQHFPLYRISDEVCTESDAAPPDERAIRFRERWDCLSRESTEFLVENLQPRLAMGGHTHHSCFVRHDPQPSADGSFVEYSIPSFSWRNRNDPSFLLGVFTPDNYKISKCHMPKENTVIMLYIVISFAILIAFAVSISRSYKTKYNKYF